MAEINDLSVTDASNIGRWPENMPFGDVNDAGRADEGLLARWYKDTDSSITASGSSNAFTITSNRTIAAYFDNLVMAFTANHSITGATTLNMNGIGAKSVKRFNGEALASGDIITGQPIIVVYKSGSDQWFMMTALAALTDNTFVDLSENASPGTPAADTARLYAFDDSTVTRVAYKDSAGNITVLGSTATQAQMEAASSTTVASSPGRQHFHPGHPKAEGRSTSAGAQVGTGYNVASIAQNGTGEYTVTMTTAMADTNYRVVSAAQFLATNTMVSASYEIVSTTVFKIWTMRPGAGGGSTVNSAGFSFAVYGDMA